MPGGDETRTVVPLNILRDEDVLDKLRAGTCLVYSGVVIRIRNICPILFQYCDEDYIIYNDYIL